MTMTGKYGKATIGARYLLPQGWDKNDRQNPRRPAVLEEISGDWCTLRYVDGGGKIGTTRNVLELSIPREENDDPPEDAGEWYRREADRLREINRQLEQATDPGEIYRLKKLRDQVAYVGD